MIMLGCKVRQQKPSCMVSFLLYKTADLTSGLDCIGKENRNISVFHHTCVNYVKMFCWSNSARFGDAKLRVRRDRGDSGAAEPGLRRRATRRVPESDP